MSYTADNWILANLNVVGYYRVNYDERNWNNLVKQLNNNHEVSTHFIPLPIVLFKELAEEFMFCNGINM